MQKEAKTSTAMGVPCPMALNIHCHVVLIESKCFPKAVK